MSHHALALIGFFAVLGAAHLGAVLGALIVGSHLNRISEDTGFGAWLSTVVPPAGSKGAPPAGAFLESTSQPTLLSQFTLSGLGGGGEVENQCGPELGEIRGAKSIDMTTGAAVPSAQPELGGRSVERAGALEFQVERVGGGRAVGSEAPHAAVPRPDDSRSGRTSLDDSVGRREPFDSMAGQSGEGGGALVASAVVLPSREESQIASVSSDPRRLNEPMVGSRGWVPVDRWKLTDDAPSRAGRRSSTARPLFSPEPPEAA